MLAVCGRSRADVRAEIYNFTVLADTKYFYAFYQPRLVLSIRKVINNGKYSSPQAQYWRQPTGSALIHIPALSHMSSMSTRIQSPLQ
jgi:hypothetical protein